MSTEILLCLQTRFTVSDNLQSILPIVKQKQWKEFPLIRTIYILFKKRQHTFKSCDKS